MTYEQKFSESEKKAHDQNIATKILRDMSSLRSQVQSNPNVSRRWIWELIQNAKDVHQPKGVSIKIEYNFEGENPRLIFKHNGKPFSTDNIRFLIEQISSKERVTDINGKRKSSGKFGTGFLTTHLLSEIVALNGVAKEEGLDYRKFELKLDRSGFEPDAITQAVKESKLSVQGLDQMPVFKEYVEEDFNTEFTYPLTDKVSINVAKAGLTDLALCLPLTLVFVPEIFKVYSDTTKQVFVKVKEEDISNEIRLISVYAGEENIEGYLPSQGFAVLTSGFTQIAIPVKKDHERISIKPIDERVPTLFCDFPLIGTEKINFPTVINNPNFNPTDPRDGIFLTTPERSNKHIDENKRIIQEAVALYFKLLEFAVVNNWNNLYLLARIQALIEVPEWIDQKWYNQNVLNLIREKLLKTRIVTDANGNLQSILAQDGTNHMWFPFSASKETRDKIWDLANDWFPHCLPRESDVEIWNKIIWEKCGKLTLEQLAIFIEHTKQTDNLSAELKGTKALAWLNKFYTLIKSDLKKYDNIVNNHSLFPSQSGTLCKKSKLARDKGDINPIFKDILDLLGQDIRGRLADEAIIKDIEFDRLLGQTDIVKEITNELLQKTTNRQSSKTYAPAFKKLLIYFQEFPGDAERCFPSIYSNKHILYDDDEVMSSISKAEQLSVLLKDFNVHNVSALRELIASGKNNLENSLLPITENLLASMGISSPEEWAKALEDKDLAALFSHDSVPTTDMFMYVQALIASAKERIVNHLRTIPEYNMDKMDDSTATTVLSGIIKDEKEISIVTRPAHDRHVIIYYGSERDILDYEPSELWVDDGINTPMKISLGHILKKGKITRFPI